MLQKPYSAQTHPECLSCFGPFFFSVPKDEAYMGTSFQGREVSGQGKSGSFVDVPLGCWKGAGY